MTGELIIAIDAGTSVLKAVAFDLAGRQIAVASLPNEYVAGTGGAVEQDMGRTWNDCCAVLRCLGETLGDARRDVAAIAVTGQGDGTWLVDRGGHPVAPAWLWLDSRAAGIVEELAAAGVRHRLYRFTGCGLNACNQSVQLLWLERHRPALLDRATTAQHCKDWLYFKLTGERATDVSEGSFTFGDFRTRRYVPEILELLGLNARAGLLPPMIDGSRVTHPLSAAAAAQVGVAAGTPVSLGAVDVVCTALGGGLTEGAGRVGCSIVGSTGMHMRLVPDAARVELPSEPGGYTMAFPGSAAVARIESNMAATLNVDWIVDAGREAARLLGLETGRREALAAFDAQVPNARPGAALFHPYIHEAGERGPFMNALARAQLSGLSSGTGFADLVRAVYEGLAFAARDCYAATGPLPAEIRLTGGAARSASFRAVLASVLGAPVRELLREEAGAAGAAMMAAVAIGAFPDMNEAVARWVTPTLGEVVAPDPALAALYDRLFPIYVDARRAMPPLWSALAEARHEEPR
jgi:erythritol kinase